MGKEYGIVFDGMIDNYIKILNTKFGLPKINRKLILNSKNGKDKLIINITNKKINYKINKEYKRGINIYNFTIKDINNIFKKLIKLGFNYYKVTNLIEFKYRYGIQNISIYINKKNKDNKDIAFITTSGGIINNYIKGIEFCNKNKFIKSIEKSLCYKIRGDELIKEKGGINDILLEYIDNIGLPCKDKKSSIKDIMKTRSNNYSFYEYPFYKISGTKLLGKKSFVENYDNTSGITIIIPTYESDNTITKVLEAINNQNIGKKNYGKIQVIIIDDASKTPIEYIIPKKKYKFQLTIIRNNVNQGRSKSRNKGLNKALFDNIIFLDSDIIIPQNYIKEMIYRINMIPNAIFMSFRKNIENNDISLKKIKYGLNMPQKCDDHRISRAINRGQISYHKIKENKIINLLTESDNFKDLGYGKIIGLYDLALSVSTHNLCFNKRYTINKFNENFTGWGMEDSFFGAEAICSGTFIIPVLSTGVYHIKHEPRAGNNQLKLEELKQNIKLYKYLLNKKI